MTDPDEAVHPVDQLRSMIEASLETIKTRMHRLSPGGLDALAGRLARAVEGDALEHPVEVIAALSKLTPRHVLGRDVLCSSEIRLGTGGEPIATIVSHQTGLFYVEALRIESDLGSDSGQFDGDLEVMSPTGTLALERCHISEFLEMTPMVVGVISKQQPLVVTIYPKPGPVAHRCRVILRGEHQSCGPLWPLP